MARLTALDVAILGRLHSAPLGSQKEIARSAGVSEAAISKRFAHLLAAGVFEGMWLTPAAWLFGRREVHASFGPAPGVTSDDVLRADDVVLVNERHDGSFSVFSAVPRPASGPSPALLELLGEPTFVTIATEAGNARISRIDWRVIQALHEDPRAPATEHARRCGLSAKTVRQRRRALSADGAIVAGPLVDLTDVSGCVVHELAVQFDRKTSKRAAAGLVPDASLIGYAADGLGAYFFGGAANVQAVYALARRVSAHALVRSVFPIFPRRRAFARDRVGAWIGQAMARVA